MTYTKFSKSSANLITLKQDFFSSNTKLLDEIKSVNNKYIQQPLRSRCKTCDNSLNPPDFFSFGVPYTICQHCGHLNGCHDDTSDFAEYLYLENKGDNYKSNYLNNYDKRVTEIYLPKVTFLKETLAEVKFGSDINVLDLGCGGGHFVKACELLEIQATGYDPSDALISIGRETLTQNSINTCSIQEFDKIILNTPANVISMIGVLEHLQHPNNALTAFNKSQAKYLYLALPMFSFSALLEHISPNVFPRLLAAGHTHIYTLESLNYLFDKFKLKVIGEWWFGTDMVDLLRNLIVQSQPNASENTINAINTLFGQHIDELQSVLDRKRASSEVHIILEKV